VDETWRSVEVSVLSCDASEVSKLLYLRGTDVIRIADRDAGVWYVMRVGIY
jgi:hypothetical protein